MTQLVSLIIKDFLYLNIQKQTKKIFAQLTLSPLVMTFADDIFKQFGTRSGPTKWS